MAASEHELDIVRVIAGRFDEVKNRQDSLLSPLAFTVRFLMDDGYLRQEGASLVPTEKAIRMMDLQAEEARSTIAM